MARNFRLQFKEIEQIGELMNAGIPKSLAEHIVTRGFNNGKKKRTR